MVKDRHNKHNTTHKTSVVGVRLTNEEVDAIETIIDLGGFSSKTEVVQMMLRPMLAQFRTAIQTKSVMKAAKVRIKEEIALNEKLNACIKASEVQTELFPDMEVQPA